MSVDFDSPLLDAARRRVLISDGAMGTMLQAVDLDVDVDFLGLEGCNEILNATRPDVVADIHRAFFEAGADLVETNTFGCNLSNLGDYDIVDRIGELAEKGAAIARQVADEMGPSEDGTPRMVLGSLGPGTKLPSLGQATFEEMRDAYARAAEGLARGGADAFLVETSQDLLQVKAAVLGCQDGMAAAGRRLPIITHVTIETTGTMLLGSDIGAALTALEPLGIDMIGLNCATGPAEMIEHLRYLTQHAGVPVSVMPNAGLPELGEHGAVYPLGAEAFGPQVADFVSEFGLSMVGGCCGTTPEHITRLRDEVRSRAKAERRVEPINAVASLYSSTPLRADAGILMIGERTNANGSKRFRDAMLAADWDTCMDIAKEQMRDGAQMIDLCVDYVGRDGSGDMAELAGRLSTSSTLPIMLDSTEPEVIRTGLEHLGGRCTVNSVNYEDGAGPESRFQKIMELVSRHGAAVVGLAIDEEGQARTADRKVEIAERIIADLTENWGIAEDDIIIDCLTFPISTGQEEVRRDGIETIEAIRRLTESHPRIHTTLGLSNISFGLNPAARQVLNSVFLHECIQVGLDTAIAHSSKILPMSKIDDRQREVALDLVYDRRREGYDPLQVFMELFDGVSTASTKDARAAELAAMPLMDRLSARIVDGERKGLEADLDAAMEEIPPLEIINTHLLSGMKTVGELFGSGQMQLPFVLQSAETMKTAVAHLEPHMEASDEDGKGRIVLATVKGDVHDIGKNLVDIILSNNGYDVVNIGIKQPIADIISAAREHKADVIGMSGLLVKSTVVMKDNLAELNSEGIAGDFPVLLGGAALTRAYVEVDLAGMYEGEVFYARDAFEGLRLMDEVMTAKRTGVPMSESSDASAKAAERRERRARSERIAAKRAAEAEPVVVPERSDVAADQPIATPPFWGTRIAKGIPVADYVGHLDERALFFGQWGLRGTRSGDGPDYDELVATEGRPRMRSWIDRLTTERILAHSAVVYGYFPAYSDGEDICVLAEPRPDAEVLHRISFPRQQRGRFLSIPDFLASKERCEAEGTVDVLPFQLVTMGTPIADFANELFAADNYRDYLEVHGLSVQLTEALAEFWHRRVRDELRLPEGAVSDEDPDTIHDYFDLKYRGARYSFGYGACPDLESRKVVVDLLEPERIGVELSEELQLHPEQSTDAFVLYHPEAKYFNV
ncbi:methionine synthase [Dietzia natronolimnaea]|uniref:methionine synthase n=1 Tax=Dietzia natronolimnaea TaxID=161920 RepID=UPI003D099239